MKKEKKDKTVRLGADDKKTICRFHIIDRKGKVLKKSVPLDEENLHKLKIGNLVEVRKKERKITLTFAPVEKIGIMVLE
jgi:hypothetical protein